MNFDGLLFFHHYTYVWEVIQLIFLPVLLFFYSFSFFFFKFCLCSFDVTIFVYQLIYICSLLQAGQLAELLEYWIVICNTTSALAPCTWSLNLARVWLNISPLLGSVLIFSPFELYLYSKVHLCYFVSCLFLMRSVSGIDILVEYSCHLDILFHT